MKELRDDQNKKNYLQNIEEYYKTKLIEKKLDPEKPSFKKLINSNFDVCILLPYLIELFRDINPHRKLYE